jgi:hypothetical protein
MFDGAQDDWTLGDPLGGKLIEWRWTRPLVLAAAVAALSIAVATSAFAQNQPRDCSGTIGGTAANITFAFQPTQYVMICNPSASATLWVSAVGTAAANASGSIGLPTAASAATSCLTLAPIPTISIIASAGSTPYTCMFR